MVDGFFQKAKEFFTGSNNDEFDQDLDREVSPASEDPYGDPADQYSGDVTPASQDPYGDPADEYSNIASADQDPYGDPADEYGR
ncbi:translation initiation factor [Nostoc sp. FACHB-110]|uniref:translation initiation factor n=1 Tax=Nostoc sp. FACHB-110 TaxID=2692834 RepID=UPI00168478EE|nr:translation initiation factor [Nostoc sp. FACHB-110]MBD2436412.1 translation initiation factor [Nostoc sp. FACHB-110]